MQMSRADKTAIAFRKTAVSCSNASDMHTLCYMFHDMLLALATSCVKLATAPSFEKTTDKEAHF